MIEEQLQRNRRYESGQLRNSTKTEDSNNCRWAGNSPSKADTNKTPQLALAGFLVLG